MTSELASMIQHAVPLVPMTDMSTLLQRLGALHDRVDAAKERRDAAQKALHDVVVERNDVLRELNRDHGIHPKELRELARLESLPLAYRIVKGENR